MAQDAKVGTGNVPEEIEAFVKENKVGRLGTINAQGYPLCYSPQLRIR